MNLKRRIKNWKDKATEAQKQGKTYELKHEYQKACKVYAQALFYLESNLEDELLEE